MRSSCPKSYSECSKFILRKTSETNEGDAEDFELHLNWVLDEPARIFLKTFLRDNSLSMVQEGKSLTIYALNE